jgi:hypothetical protein
MSIRTLNGLNGSSTNVVITNHMTASLPLEQTQASCLDPILIGIKGLTTMGNENQIMKVDASGQLAWATDTTIASNWDLSNGDLYPLATATNVVIGGDDTDNGSSRKLLVKGTAQIEGITHCYGSSAVAGYINLYTSDKLYHTSLLPNNTVSTDIYLPDTSGTLVNKDSTDTLTNKSFNDFTSFNNSLKVKSNVNASSGAVYFQESTNTGTNTLSLQLENHSLASDISIFLPNSQADTILVGKNTTDILLNKTFDDFFICNAGIQIKNGASSSGYLRLFENSGSGTNYIDLMASNAITDNVTIELPNKGGVITLDNGNIQFAYATNWSYIFDPYAGAVSSSNYAFAFQSNGTHVLLNCRDAGAGVTSHIDLAFGGYTRFKFNTDLTLKIGADTATGGTTYTFPTPASGTTATLAIVGETSSWVITGSNTISPITTAVNKLLLKGTTSSIKGDTIPNPFASGSYYIGNTLSEKISSDDITVKLLRVANVVSPTYYESQLTCLLNRLKINTPVDITGDLTTTTNINATGNITATTNITATGSLSAGSNTWRSDLSGGINYVWNPTPAGSSVGYTSATQNGCQMMNGTDGSTMFFNTTNQYLSGSTNYFAFRRSSFGNIARIEMDGNAYITGTWNNSDSRCDSRLKHNQKVYDKNATQILNKIVIKDFMKSQIINFDDIDPNNSSKGILPFSQRLCPMEDCKYDIGVIAQELYEIPELSFMVQTNDWGDERPATIANWNPLISLLIKSNQEQQIAFETAKAKQLQLESELDTYKSIVDKLLNAKSFADFKKAL